MPAILFLIAFQVFALADERPKIPEPGEDKVLTHNLSAKEFFANKQNQPECRKNWDEAYKTYNGLKSELYKLLGSGASAEVADRKEDQMLSARSTLLDLTVECGPCATQKLQKKTVVTAGKKEYWSITDGSCYWPSQDARSTFEKAAEFLMNTEGYARHRGGFDSILEFLPIDRATGNILPHVKKVDITKPLDTYIAVRAKGPLTFDYSFENKFEIREANGKKEFILRFYGFPQHESLNDLEVSNVSLAGTKRPITRFKTLTRVIGMWYFNTDGYYRYFTAADFESILFSTSLGSADAERTLLDTVFAFAERGL